MGKEERAKKERQEIGKFNVCVTLLILTPNGLMSEPINCKSWNHAGNYLALDLFDGTMRIVCLNQYHGFSISPINDDPDGSEIRN